jgi:hypothetical protein
MKLKNVLLQGCNYRSGSLVEGDANLPEFISLPTLYIYYTVEPEDAGSSSPFPLYSSLTREKLLAKINLKIDGKYKDKIIAGVGLFLKE